MAPRDFSNLFGSILTPYRMGEGPARFRPLDRYLPPLPTGMIEHWVVPPPAQGGWIFDPFGQSPDMLIDLVHRGWKVLVCLNNPILRLLLDLVANPPSVDEVTHCASVLASSARGSQRLEQLLQGLYLTECRDCQSALSAEMYLWEKGVDKPYAVVYHCPNCGSQGEYPLLPVDDQALQESRRNTLPRAWAIEKIAPAGDPLREDAGEVVDSHLDRPLYFLFTLLNRLQSLPFTEREKRILSGILLDVLDDATPIHQINHTIPRPRQFMIPVRFHEHNLLKSFEDSVGRWLNPGAPVLVTEFPNLPDRPGICLYEGRVRDLAEKQIPTEINRVCTILPRPNQAFWTLSAVWSAWLFGREEAASMAQVISRRRYDWNWHTNALSQVFQSIQRIVSADIQWQVLLTEAEPAFLSSAFHALNQSGYCCENFAIRAEDELVQSTWRKEAPGTRSATAMLSSIVQRSAVDYLGEKGEPGEYLDMTCAALLGIDQRIQVSADLPNTTFLQQVKAAFSNPTIFRHFGPGEQTLESGQWMLHHPPEGIVSFSDRIEESVVSILSAGTAITLPELEDQVRERIFPIFHPIQEYLMHLIDSYTEEETPGSNHWIIKVNEHPALRSSDQKTIRGMLSSLGRQFGLTVSHADQSIEWSDGSGSLLYRFHILANARFSHLVSAREVSSFTKVLVLPGSRSNLVAYKRRLNPWLDEQLDDWHLIKYRHISRLVENPMLTREVFDLLLDNDPAEYQPLQMQLF